MFDLELKSKLGADAIQISVNCETQQSMYYKQIARYKKNSQTKRLNAEHTYV